MGGGVSDSKYLLLWPFALEMLIVEGRRNNISRERGTYLTTSRPIETFFSVFARHFNR